MQRMQTPRGVEFVLPAASKPRAITPVFFLLFGAMFGGMPLLMLLVVLFGFGNDMPLLQRLGFAAFISIFVLIGAAIFSAGLLMLFGSTVVRVEGNTVRAGRKLGPIQWMLKRKIAPDAVLVVQAAKSQLEALRGLRQIVARSSLGTTTPVVHGLTEADARELATALADELGIQAESTPASQDPDRMDEVLEQQDQSLKQRTRDVELPTAAGQMYWKVLLPIAIVADAIVVAVVVGIYFAKGSLPIVGMVVGGVFFTIATVMVVAAIHQAMADRKLGAPVVTLSVHPVLLGEPFEIRFSQPVKAGGKHNGVKATVFMRETARYRRGTNTYTVTHDQFKQEVELLPPGSLVPGQDLTGNMDYEIPTTAMHTFTANNNNVRWIIKIHTILPKWPDYRRSFEFEVFPRAYVETSTA